MNEKVRTWANLIRSLTRVISSNKGLLIAKCHPQCVLQDLLKDKIQCCMEGEQHAYTPAVLYKL